MDLSGGMQKNLPSKNVASKQDRITAGINMQFKPPPKKNFKSPSYNSMHITHIHIKREKYTCKHTHTHTHTHTFLYQNHENYLNN